MVQEYIQPQIENTEVKYIHQIYLLLTVWRKQIKIHPSESCWVP